MVIYQDFVKVGEDEKARCNFIMSAIQKHKESDEYKIAKAADLYDRQKNITINEYVKQMFTIAGAPVEDFTASNSKIASNFFHRLNTQRCTYSLGNGITFADNKDLKEQLGSKFDTDVYNVGYNALIHGVSFGFRASNRIYNFPLTEFVPMWDEWDGTLKAGIRFWQIDEDKPMVAVLYELDGYTKYAAHKKGDKDKKTIILEMQEPKRAYKLKIAENEVGDSEVVAAENYSSLPVVPMWGSKLKQSTLIGMQQAIDSFDLIRSGFANDLTDCAEIYWLIENCGGMNDDDLQRFRDRLKLQHIAEVDGDAGAKATPYTQEVPYAARQAYLNDIRAGIYEDFGALDVHAVSADSTNDHLEAAYQPMDENADDFEYQLIEFIQQILALEKIEDTPLFKRNRISNVKEQVDIILSEAEYLDEETILSKLPNVTPDEIEEIKRRKAAENAEKLKRAQERSDLDNDYENDEIDRNNDEVNE